ncbi:MAG: efflux RND transporter periplasmic adaptor subunit [Magnetococcales bacterium]|nr:efflux RND transporter periplasmic adaptor subunit [Magnetococcales bacterium]
MRTRLPGKESSGVKRLLQWSALFAVVWTGAVSWADGPPGAPPPPAVVLVPVVRQVVTLSEEAPGRMLAVRSAEVRARVEGIVEKRLFTEGSLVKANALLYRLDDRMLKAQVQLAEAGLAKAEAEAVLAKQTLDRHAALVGDNAVTRQEYDQAVALHRKALAQVAEAKATLSKSRIDLDYAAITAPIAGRVGRSLVTEGALVGKGSATHLTTIEQLDPIQVSFSQSSNELARLRRGLREGSIQAKEEAKVTLMLDDAHSYAHAGRLLFTEMAVDPQTGSVLLRAEFPNPDQELLPGQFVRVRLETGRSEALTVPQAAVQTTPQGQSVLMVDKENKVVARPVKTGGFSGPDWIIRDGLNEGERVILEGLQKARPGTVVAPKP